MATYAVFQSPVEYTGPFSPRATHRRQMPAAQKPKLTLNTTPHRSFGRASTGLRLETLSPSSPTRLNTYKNSYDPQARSHQKEPPGLRLPTTLVDRNGTNAESMREDGIIEPSRLPNAQEDGFLDSNAVPYSLQAHLRSILTNGPHGKRQRSVRSPSAASPSISGRKPRLSFGKRVCFSDPLSEDIQTTQYLLRHSDIRSRSSSPAGTSNVGNEISKSESTTGSKATWPLLPPKAREVAPKKSRSSDVGDDEDEDESEDSGNEDSSTIPKTPVAGRNKKEREWVWTLGPLPGATGPGSTLPASPSEEDLDDSLEESVAAASAFNSPQETLS